MNFTILTNKRLLSPTINKTTTQTCELILKPEPLFTSDYFSQEERQHGAVIFHLLALVYVLILAEHVSNSYLMPSIEYLSYEKLKLSTQVAGSTILASASSSSEIFTSLFGVLLARNDLSINTIVGSASYNLLVITSICCFCVYKYETKLRKYQLIRDFLLYSFTLTLLILFFKQNKSNRLYWYQSLFLLIIYSIFIFLNVNDAKIKAFFEKMGKRFRKEKKIIDIDDEIDEMILNNERRNQAKMFQVLNKNKVVDLNIDFLSKDYNEPYDVFQPYKEFKPLNFSTKFKLSFVLPARLFAFFTIVDFRRFESRNKDKFLYVTIITCLFQIALSSYLLVFFVVQICHTFNLPESVIGFSFVSVITNIEETIAAISLCKRELKRVQMNKKNLENLNSGLSNCIASTIYELTVGIGLPYTINSLFFRSNFFTYIYGKNVPIFIFGLLSCLLLFMLLLVIFRMRFTKYFGYSTLTVYVIYTIMCVFIELDMLKLDFFYLFKNKC